MKRHIYIFIPIALLAGILLTGCAQTTASPAQPGAAEGSSTGEAPATGEASTPSLEPSLTPEATSTPELTTTPLPTAAPITVQVAEGNGIDHELVFAIRNLGQYSGEDGRPAWLGWGANNLAVAPDGSFWIADTPADPDRLLHYSVKGELLGTISMRMGGEQYWAGDIAVDSSSLWVLDSISQPIRVMHIGLDGSLLASYPIPEQFATYVQEETIMPGLWHIPFIENGTVFLDGPVGIVGMTVNGDTAEFTKVDGYRIGGRVYTEVKDGLMVDSLRVGMKLLQPEHFLNSAGLIGAAADGSFYVREDEGNTDQGKSEPPDRFVRRYSASGDLVGIALLPLPELDASYDVSLGPDGNVYAMFSRSDHSVDILRLGFYTGAGPLLSPYTSQPQPTFKPVMPSGKSPATEVDAAREAMLSFYAALAEGRFDEAAARYGGSYEEFKTQDEAISPDQPGMAWQNICQMEFCLKVSDILDTQTVASDEYVFLVGFVTDNGIRFDYSICCGYFGPTPTTEWFVYSVNVKKVDGQWLVMSGPVPRP